jgi:hypothetical protein
MKRLLLVLVPVCAAVAGVVVSRWWCAQEYQVTVQVSPSGIYASPYRISGEIAGCGLRQLEGKSSFGLLLSRGGEPSRTRATHGASSTITFEAAVAPDGASVWYVATMESGGRARQLDAGRVIISPAGRADARSGSQP